MYAAAVGAVDLWQAEEDIDTAEQALGMLSTSLAAINDADHELVLVADNFRVWAEREMAPHQQLLDNMREMQFKIAQREKSLCQFLMERWEEGDLQFDSRDGIDGMSKKPLCPVARPMHLLQRCAPPWLCYW